jgi:thiamine-phosphate pyrophosphorylase
MQSLVALAARLRPRPRGRKLPSLWLTTDAKRTADPAVAVARLPAGCGVILRHPDARQLRRLAEEIVPLCRRRKLICLIAGDWRLAARCDAHGVHLSERSARSHGMVRAWCRQRRRLLTVAAHGEVAARRGARLGADAVLLAPVFPTRSHPEARALGVLRFAAITRRIACPVIALGGVTPRTAQRLNGAGAAGFAGIDWLRT